MNRTMFVLVFAFSSLPLLSIAEQQDNFLKRQYKSLKSDFDLIKKCYGTTSPACTDNERKEAQKVVLRIGSKIGAVILALVSIYGGYRIYSFWRRKGKEKAMQERLAKLGVERDQERAKLESIQPEIAIILGHPVDKMEVGFFNKREVAIFMATKEGFTAAGASLNYDPDKRDQILNKLRTKYPYTDIFTLIAPDNTSQSFS